MASLTPTGGSKDYFKELRLKRQQRAQTIVAGVGSSTPVAEAVIPITMVPGPDTSRPPANPKKRTKDDHRGRSSRRHGEHSSSGKSSKRG